MASQADRREPTAKGYHTGSLERGKSVAARFVNVSGLQGVYLKKAGSRAAVTDSVLIGLNPVPMATKVSGMIAEMPARMALAPRSWTASIARISHPRSKSYPLIRSALLAQVKTRPWVSRSKMPQSRMLSTNTWN